MAKPLPDITEPLRLLEEELSNVISERKAIQGSIGHLKEARVGYINEYVSHLLPDVTGDTYRKLRTSVPRFLTSDIKEVFKPVLDLEAKGGLIGWIQRRVLDVTPPKTVFASMQAKLASFLDRTNYDSLKQQSQKLISLNERDAAAFKVELKLRNAIAQLKAKQGSITARDMEKLHKAARTHYNNPKRGVYYTASKTDTRRYDYDDDSTLLQLILLAELNNRTVYQPTPDVIVPPPFQGGGGSSGGAGASGSWDASPSRSDDVLTSLQNADAERSILNSTMSDIMNQPIDGVPLSIATDDSLGAFS